MHRCLLAPQTINNQIWIKNQHDFKEKIQLFVSQGSSNVEVVTDYDLTLTKFRVNGVRGCSTYQLLQSSVLFDEKAKAVQELYNHYHPLEVDPNIPEAVKQQYMHDWWEKSNDALLEEGFHIKDFVPFIYRSTLHFRHGIQDFLGTCSSKRIPITIISGGIGNLIDASFDEVYPSREVKVFSNYIEFDSDGKSSKFVEPSVRTDKSKLLEGIECRKNIILMGDLPTDIRMVEPLNYENCLKVGFLNDIDVYDMNHYKEIFDVLVINDGDLTLVNLILCLISGEPFDLIKHPDFTELYALLTTH